MAGRRHTPLRLAFARPWPGKRRGLKLWFLSIIIGLKGVGYALGHNPAQTDAALRFVTRAVPLEVAGWCIIALCAVSAFCAYCHYGRDVYGYAILTGFAFGWAAVYAVAPLVGSHHGGILPTLWHYPADLFVGEMNSWQGLVTYAAIGIFLLVSANDPEPSTVVVIGP